MSEQEQQESQKTVVAFVAGLLIGGLLVWIFSGSPADSPEQENSKTDDESSMVEESGDGSNRDTENTTQENTTTSGESTSAPTMQTGDGEVTVSNQSAGASVTIEGATFPTDEGWIAVRSYTNGELSWILGAARYSKSDGLVPESIPLVRNTSAGQEYAIVFFTENGDGKFDLATDSQIEGPLATFTAE